MPSGDRLEVRDDETDFYGKHYFEHLAATYDLPPIEVRARSDLSQRCIFWLRGLLKYKTPPARVLELGCAHGGFTAMLRWAGFDATGLDLSPSLVEGAHRRFHIPVLAGPVESQAIPPASLDVIVLMDVLEHLGDPLGTIGHCASLLKPDGLFFIQTPQYREGRTLEQMHAGGDAFVQMLLPDQHLYLFSRSSVKLLLRKAGVEYTQFEPAMFAHYDMALAASPQAIKNSIPVQEAAIRLQSSPEGHAVVALMDLDARFQELQLRFAESENDRAARLQNMQQLEQLLAESQADRSARLDNIHRLERNLAEAAATNERLKDLHNALIVDLSKSDTQIAELQDRIRELDARLDSATRDCESFQSRLLEEQTRHSASDVEIESLTLRLKAREALLDRVRRSYVFRLMRKLGLWSWLELEPAVLPAPVPTRRKRQKGGLLRRVVVDLTPVLPGLTNGGAKIMTIELLRNLAKAATGCEFILLTSEASHEELGALDAANIRRVCVNAPAKVLRRSDNIAIRAKRILVRFLPENVLQVLAAIYRRVTGQAAFSVLSGSLLERLEADLLFCPFTSPFFFDPAVPVVSVIYDLQHVYYPQFFQPQEIEERERNIQQAFRLASRVVCISEYVRETVLRHSSLPPERVRTIHIVLPNRLAPPSPALRESVLEKHALVPERFLLYPANFWPHKNHEILLTAFGMYLSTNPASDLKLVLTGAPSPRRDELIEAAKRMRLGHAVVFGGALPDEEFSVVMHSCAAMIFPSLFEGFGMPLLEAMAAGVPVLSSNATSLPEVAGDAALYFDPRKPNEIVEAITRIESDPELRRRLAEKSGERLSAFGSSELMAASYLRVFHEVTADPSGASAPGIYGVFEDRWLGERVTIFCGQADESQTLVLKVEVPDWVPMGKISIRLSYGGMEKLFNVPRGGKVTMACPLGETSERIELFCSPVFQPSSYGLGSDSRSLSCCLDSAEIISAEGAVILDLKSHLCQLVSP
jgi:glycosyltransferase involved in cell wall biosynthesis/2-polyprenyl-3-methyl-5-hydroxy-6-metoxy-1,4-benzoquinol methylase